MCDLSNDGNTVTSVSWSERGHQLAVGTHHGYVSVWDVHASKQVNILKSRENSFWAETELSGSSTQRYANLLGIRQPETVLTIFACDA